MTTPKVGAILELDTKDAKSRIKEIDKEIKALSKKAVNIEANLTKLNGLKTRLSEIKRQISELNNQKLSLSSSSNNIQRIKTDLQNVDTLLGKLSDRSREISTQLLHVNDPVKNLRQQISEQTNLINKYKSAIKSIKTSDILDSDTKKMWSNSIDKQLQSAVRYQNDLKTSLTEATTQANRLKSELIDVKNNIQQSTKNLKATKSGLEKELNNAQKEAKRTQTEIDKLTAKINKLDSEKIDIETDLKNFESLQRELNETDRKIGDLESDKVDIQLQLDNYNQVMSQLNGLANATKRIQNFGKSLNNVGKSMTGIFSGVSNNPIGKFTHFLTQGIGYSSLYRLTSGFMNMIESSFSGAINRMDTIANSYRTFEAMNFDSSVVETSIADLEDRILGLPTTLNDAISQVTMLSAITNDLPKSVRIFDAFNNAILAFGGNQEKANRAITQFSQAMGTGKVDARTYLSLTEAGMSPALAKVAEMLGYSSENMGEFKSALGEGEVSIEEFTDALILLNENGYDTMRALNSLAKENAIKSIGSSMIVMQTQVQKGWQSIIQEISDTLEALGYGSIAQNIAKFGNFIRDGMTGVSDFINQNRGTIGEFLDWLIDKFNALKEELSKFDFGSFVEGVKSFSGVFDALKDGLSTLYDMFKSLANFVGGGDTSKGLGRLLTGWLTFGYGMRLVGTLINKSMTPLNALAGLGQYLLKQGKISSSNKLFGFANSSTGLFGALTGKNKNVDSSGKITSSFDINGFKNSMANIAKLAGMGGTIILYAKALEQIDKAIPDDIGSFTPKLITLIGTMSTMAGLSAGMGKLTDIVGIQNELMGVVSLIGAGGALWLIAQAIGEIDKKVPDNIGSFASKMANLGIAIGGIGIVIGALGALASAGGGLGGVIMVLGELFTISFALTLQIVAESISAMADSIVDIGNSLKKFGKVKIDKEGVSTNLKTVTDALDQLSEWSGGFWGAIGKLAQQKIDEGNIAQASSNLEQLLDVAEGLSNVQNIKDLDGTKFEENIKSMRSILETLQKYLPLPVITIPNTTTESMTSVTESINSISSLTEAVKNFVAKGVPNFDENALSETLQKISTVVTNLKDIQFPDVKAGASLTGENAQNLVSVLDGLLQIVPKINEVIKTVNETPVDSDAFKNALTSIADLLGSINNDLMPNGQTRIGYNLKEFIDADTVQNVVDALNNLSTLVNSASSFMQNYADKAVDWETLKENINTIMESFNGTIDGEGSVEINTEKLETLSSAIGTFETITNKLETIGGKQINFDNIDAMILRIQTIISSLSTLTSVESANTLTEQVNTLITTFQTLLTTLEGFDEQFLTVGTSWGNNLFQGFSEADVSGQCVEYVEEMMATLTAIDMTPVGTDYGNEVVNGFKNAIANMPSAISSVASSLYNYSTTFAQAGTSLGNTFADSFNSAVSNLEVPDVNVEHDSRGGEVPTQYYARGGFTKKGTDTIPAMLTPGEFVVSRKAVKGIGVSFLNKINSMDFKGAFKSLMSARGENSIQATYNQTINNTTNNNYGDRSVTINGGNERQQMLKANKFMKGLAY